MGNSIFGISVSGLHAAQAGLLTTSHNIANVNTAGFSRQATLQSASQPNFSGSGFLGSGVSVDTVRRSYSSLLEMQVRDTRSQAAASAELASQLGAVDNLLADPSAGLSPAMSDFFQGLNDVASHPGDAASRQAVIARANALAARFHDIDGRLTELRHGVNLQIETSVGTVNAYTASIADLNNRIMVALGNGSQAQPPNDLMDQRDALLRDLNKEVGATAVNQSDGSVNVFLGSRQPLVVGGNSYALSSSVDPESPRDSILTGSTGGAQITLRTADIVGGRLGGLLEFRDTDLANARNSLGRIALTVAQDFNAQHQLGQDRSGALGGAFFAAGAPAAISRTTNAGSAQLAVAIASHAALGTSSYRVAYDGANYNVTRLADNVTQSFASLPQTVDGVTIALLSGTPMAGDSFRLEPTEFGASGFSVLVSDPARIAAAAPIATGAAAANTGTARVSAGTVDAVLPLDPNLQQPVTITFTGPGTFNVSGTGTGNPVGLAYTPGAPISYNGWTLNITGTPAAGDQFSVAPNAGGVSDNRNALALSALQGARTLEGGTASYEDAYSQLVSQVGNRTREAQVTSTSQDALARQAEAVQQSVSGVNLDEEAANLLRYQQAYQASGKALAIANTLFDSLLEAMR